MSITGVLFLLAYLFGCGLALIRAPIFGLVTYILVYYLHPPSRWWGETLPDIRWAFVAALVTLIAVLIHRGGSSATTLFRSGAVWGMFLFLLWILVQSAWALDADMHADLLDYMTKYTLVLFLIGMSIRSTKELKLFLWAHVLGCGYLGWIAFTSYTGGRFEGFGGPSMADANSAAIQLVTGIFAGASLFLGARLIERVALVGSLAFVVNALITTISRSGFLATGVAGIIFNIFAPPTKVRSVRLFSLFGLVMFTMLAGSAYWERIKSVWYVGEEVEGVDTGSGRLVIMKAQFEMFKSYPLGCGHRCTVTLSPMYLDEKHLTGRESKGRSSHNTFMTLLVEQGIPGVLAYVGLMMWTAINLLALRSQLKSNAGFLPMFLPTIAAVLGAIAVGDLFVDYLKLEVRFWFIGLLVVSLRMAREAKPPVPARSLSITSEQPS